MLLAIDVGNTETVVGLFADDPAAPVDESVPRDGTEPVGLAHHWRLSTVDVRTADEHAAAAHPAARPQRARHRRRRVRASR